MHTYCPIIKLEYLTMTKYTVLGIFIIVLWSTSVAFSRSLTEELGTLTSASYINLTSGILGSIYLIAKLKSVQKLLNTSIHYLIGYGALFVAYVVCFFLLLDYL